MSHHTGRDTMLTTTTSPTPDNLDLSPEPHPLVDGAIVMTDRYRVEFLPDYEPPDIHRREITAATWKNAHGALVSVGEDDGLILRLEGKRRPHSTWRHMGRELDEFEAKEIMTETRRTIPEFACWDYRLVEVVVTDGPEQKAELLESTEQAKRRSRDERKQQYESTNALASATDKLTDMLQGNVGVEKAGVDLTPDKVLDHLRKQLTDSQIEEMLLTVQEEKPKRGPGRPRKDGT